ncbi:MAG: DUF1285 domain-containing protein [Gammaproteobacteria bacterium]|nr:DUF1285 domain-containing protein [Gammaproteobacteria bacterium]
MQNRSTITLEALLARLGEQKHPPVAQWQPDHCGEIDIRILRDGRWLHDGAEINRPELVRLFAGILRREEGGFYLVTPAEKLRIQVEDAPFLVVSMQQLLDDKQRPLIVLTTNVGDELLVDDQHALWVEQDPVSGEPSPYVHVREGLNALLSRSVFYELVDAGEICGKELLISSAGCSFSLGAVAQD